MILAWRCGGCARCSRAVHARADTAGYLWRGRTRTDASTEEAGRYLETFKAYEHKPADMIKGRVNPDYMSQVQVRHPQKKGGRAGRSRALHWGGRHVGQLTDTLTSIRSVNKTDVVTLASTFGVRPPERSQSKHECGGADARVERAGGVANRSRCSASWRRRRWSCRCVPASARPRRSGSTTPSTIPSSWTVTSDVPLARGKPLRRDRTDSDDGRDRTDSDDGRDGTDGRGPLHNMTTRLYFKCYIPNRAYMSSARSAGEDGKPEVGPASPCWLLLVCANPNRGLHFFQPKRSPCGTSFFWREISGRNRGRTI